jgi:hypothetical protein
MCKLLLRWQREGQVEKGGLKWATVPTQMDFPKADDLKNWWLMSWFLKTKRDVKKALPNPAVGDSTSWSLCLLGDGVWSTSPPYPEAEMAAQALHPTQKQWF